jgi:rhodanese-related sulfurtransferase
MARAATMAPRKTVDQLLAEARDGLRRMSPMEASSAMADGTVLVDIRSDSQRERDGVVPGARFVPRNVFEWRLDPAGSYRDPELAEQGRSVVVMCNEGYQSSLAAATANQLGLDAADLDGGFQAWRAAGLPVSEPGRE